MGLVAGGVGLLIFGIIIVAISMSMTNYVDNSVNDCSQWYGRLAQELDSQTARNCNNANITNTGAQFGIITGGLMTVIGVICLGVGLVRKPQTPRTI